MKMTGKRTVASRSFFVILANRSAPFLLNISLSRPMAFEETVKGGVYIYPRVIPSFIPSFAKLPAVVEILFRHSPFDPKENRSLPG